MKPKRSDGGGTAAILVAPDSFKGSLTALEAACHLAGGIKTALPSARPIVQPLADGGEGTVEAIRWACGGQRVFVQVRDALSRPRRASYLRLPDGTAAIEMAEAAGLTVVPPGQREPLITTTFGVGELIRHAVDRGARTILVGTGGSATVDGGAGALSALGVRFIDGANRCLAPGSGALAGLHRVEVPEGLRRVFREVRLRVLCDVDNPLLGAEGAARTFGPQKGASPATVEAMERSLARFAELTHSVTGTSLDALPGAGSAGGLAGGLAAYLGGELALGARVIMELTGFPARVREAGLVATGEGCIDATSARGKVVMAVAEVARHAQVPCVAVAGRLGDGHEAVLQAGVRGVWSCTSEGAPDDPGEYWRTPGRLASIGADIARTFAHALATGRRG